MISIKEGTNGNQLKYATCLIDLKLHSSRIPGLIRHQTNDSINIELMLIHYDRLVISHCGSNYLN